MPFDAQRSSQCSALFCVFLNGEGKAVAPHYILRLIKSHVRLYMKRARDGDGDAGNKGQGTSDIGAEEEKGDAADVNASTAGAASTVVHNDAVLTLPSSKWDVDGSTTCTVERGIIYQYPGVNELMNGLIDIDVLAGNHGAVVVAGVPAAALPPTWVVVDNLDADGLIHIVVVPCDKPVIVRTGCRPCVWSASEVVPAPFGRSWVHLDGAQSLMTALDAFHDAHPAAKVYLVLSFVPTLTLARVPFSEDMLAVYALEAELYVYTYTTVPATLWVFASALVHEVTYVAQFWGADVVLSPSLDVDSWTPVFDALATGKRVLVLWTLADYIPVSLSSVAHVGVLTSDSRCEMVLIRLCDRDSATYDVLVTRYMVRALQLAHGKGRHPDMVWAPRPGTVSAETVNAIVQPSAAGAVPVSCSTAAVEAAAEAITRTKDTDGL